MGLVIDLENLSEADREQIEEAAEGDDPDGLDEAASQNIPVLSYLANETDTPFMACLSPLIAAAAISVTVTIWDLFR